MLSRIFRVVVLAVVLMTSAPSAEACPMCQAANEDGQVDGFEGSQAMTTVPRAYMYSILFMLAVPAGLLTTFGIGLYRLSKREHDSSMSPVQS